MALKGNPRNLRRLNQTIATLPTVLAQKVAARAAAEITALARASFDGGQTVYGDARPAGKHGNALSLVATGFTRDNLQFVSDGGTKIRASWRSYAASRSAILLTRCGAARCARPPRWSRSWRLKSCGGPHDRRDRIRARCGAPRAACRC
jgi:hypothetical protein